MMGMNRRSFMKKVGGALAGVVGLALPSKKATEFVGKFDPKMANIDSNWANQNWTYFQDNNYRLWWIRTLSRDEIVQMHREPFAMFTKPTDLKLNKNHPLSKGLVSYELFTRT